MSIVNLQKKKNTNIKKIKIMAKKNEYGWYPPTIASFYLGMLLLKWETGFALPESLSEEEMKSKFNLFAQILRNLDTECPEASYHGVYSVRMSIDFAFSEEEKTKCERLGDRLQHPLFSFAKELVISYSCFAATFSGYYSDSFFTIQLGYPLKKWETPWDEIEAKKNFLIKATKEAFDLF